MITYLDVNARPVYTWKHILVQRDLPLVEPVWQGRLGLERGMITRVAKMSRPFGKAEEEVAVDGFVLLETRSKRDFGKRFVAELIQLEG